MRLLLILICALSGCGQGAPPPNQQQGPERLDIASVEPRVPVPVGEPKLTNTAEVRGLWHVREVSGRMLPASAQVQLSILSDEMHLVSGCVRWNWNLRFDGERLRLTQVPSPSPQCARALTSEETEIERVIRQAEHLVRRSDAMIFIWGPDGNLVLTRPENKARTASTGLP